MKAVISDVQYECLDFSVQGNGVSFLLSDHSLTSVSGEVKLTSDDGFLLRTDDTSAYARSYINDAGWWVFTSDPAPSPADDPLPTTPTIDERVTQLESNNATLSAQLKASIESNTMLEDCLVETAGVVYA